MKKVYTILVLLYTIASAFVIYILYTNYNHPKLILDGYIKKIDSLEYDISLIKQRRDSIKTRIDTTYVKIKENEIYYKETVTDIINNSTNEDYLFFINYLNRKRFTDSINSFTIKAN